MGFYYEFSEVWQTTLNTIIALFTFLTLIPMQRSEMRETTAMQIKLNEIIAAMEDARSSLVYIEEAPEEGFTEN